MPWPATARAAGEAGDSFDAFDRASASFSSMLKKSPSERSTCETLAFSAAVLVLVTIATLSPAYYLPLMAANTWQEQKQDLYVTWVLWAAYTLLHVTHNATGRARAHSWKAVARRAAVVGRQMAVTDGMEFSSADSQSAFERWPGHHTLDRWPLSLALMGQVVQTAQMLQRREVCSPASVLHTVPFAAAYVARLLTWRRLSLAQRSWLNLAISGISMAYMVAMVYQGDTCLPSFFKDVAAASLPGRLVAQTVLTAMLCLSFPVKVRHMPWQAGQLSAGVVGFFHLVSPLYREDPYLQSAAARLQLGVMCTWAAVLWMLALSVRVTFAAHAMLQFLRSLRRD
eukprot:jgi/Tetstr1/421751/TSEL_001210.t1